MIKAALLAVLLVLSLAYTEENHVLVLTADDLPAVTQEFSHILVEFYAPWYNLQHKGVVTVRNLPLSTMK